MTESKKPREKRLHELLTSKLVDIYVGPNSTHWPIHERLLCYHSKFFTNLFYDKNVKTRPGANNSYGLPEDDDLSFELLVGWLYAGVIKHPKEEKDLGPLLDLYLLADKLEMEKLRHDLSDEVREFYHHTNTYPALRRVQYIYANTSEDNVLREMMVGSIARMLALGDTVPNHWAGALQKNGQLALDIIRSIQRWHLSGGAIPDARARSEEMGKGGGFSEVEESAVKEEPEYEEEEAAAEEEEEDEAAENGTADESAAEGEVKSEAEEEEIAE